MINRVLDSEPCDSLDAYVAAGGGRAVALARDLGPDGVIDLVSAAGLRGRGGAGFPTGIKWRTVADAETPAYPTPVVVNAAEGEPGTFKDRTLLRRNPYKILEGAAIAAVAVGASEVFVATKASFSREIRRLRRAIEEIAASAVADGITFRLALGPDAYLFGEETALLEVVEGRQPFPRIAPPYRRGLDPNEADVQRNASRLHLAVEGGSDEPPALVDNVETLANVPAIILEGADWFRSVGTDGSPGTLICTITGHTRRHGVAEFPMGTPLSEVIDSLGGGARIGRHLLAAASGVSNPLLPADRFDTPLSYEAMAAEGTALGAGGFIVFDDTCDPVAIAHAMSRFLAVESCGQCEACKADGLTISNDLERMRIGSGSARDLAEISTRLDTVIRGARCFLAYQQQRTVGSVLELFPGSFSGRPRLDRTTAPDEIIAPVVDIIGSTAILDTESLRKQPDWSYHHTDSGTFPAALYGNTPVVIRPHVHTSATAATARSTGGNGTAGTARDEFESIRGLHRELDGIIDRLDRAKDSEAANAALSELEDALERHHDVTDHIVYPLIRRVVPGVGDDAAWSADHAEDTVERLTRHLVAAHAEPTSENIAQLRSGIDEHISHVEHFVIPMLRNHLDEDQLLRLDSAVATALAHAVPRSTPDESA